MSTGSQRRLFYLDFLRGVAVLLVVLRHAPQPTDGESFVSDQALLFAKVMYRIGWCGVDLFFVLSGFLISKLLFREIAKTGTLQFVRFWLRRGLKIWPSYFVAYGGLTIALVLAAWQSGQIDEGWEIARRSIPNFFFVQNYFPAEYRWRHSWSLAIEEQFYTTLPLLLLAGLSFPAVRARMNLGPTTALFTLALSAVLAGRLWELSRGATWDEVYYPTHLRCDGLLFGVFLGYLRTFQNPLFVGIARRAGQWVLVGLPLILFMLVRENLQESPFILGFGFTILYLYFGLCVTWAAEAQAVPGWKMSLLTVVEVIGFYSYTIYLAHSVVHDLPGYDRLEGAVRTLLGGTSWAGFVCFCVCSILGGILLSKVVELPLLRWRNKILASTTSIT